MVMVVMIMVVNAALLFVKVVLRWYSATVRAMVLVVAVGEVWGGDANGDRSGLNVCSGGVLAVNMPMVLLRCARRVAPRSQPLLLLLLLLLLTCKEGGAESQINITSGVNLPYICASSYPQRVCEPRASR
jgi:hypothetical protein